MKKIKKLISILATISMFSAVFGMVSVQVYANDGADNAVEILINQNFDNISEDKFDTNLWDYEKAKEKDLQVADGTLRMRLATQHSRTVSSTYNAESDKNAVKFVKDPTNETNTVLAITTDSTLVNSNNAPVIPFISIHSDGSSDIKNTFEPTGDKALYVSGKIYISDNDAKSLYGDMYEKDLLFGIRAADLAKDNYWNINQNNSDTNNNAPLHYTNFMYKDNKLQYVVLDWSAGSVTRSAVETPSGWHTIEYYVTKVDGKAQIKEYVDGVLYDNITGRTTINNFNYIMLSPGVKFTKDGTTYQTTVYYDDIKAALVPQNSFNITNVSRADEALKFDVTFSEEISQVDKTMFSVLKDGTEIANAITSAQISADKKTVTLTYDAAILESNTTYTLSSSVTSAYRQILAQNTASFTTASVVKYLYNDNFESYDVNQEWIAVTEDTTTLSGASLYTTKASANAGTGWTVTTPNARRSRNEGSNSVMVVDGSDIGGSGKVLKIQSDYFSGNAKSDNKWSNDNNNVYLVKKPDGGNAAIDPSRKLYVSAKVYIPADQMANLSETASAVVGIQSNYLNVEPFKTDNYVANNIYSKLQKTNNNIGLMMGSSATRTAANGENGSTYADLINYDRSDTAKTPWFTTGKWVDIEYVIDTAQQNVMTYRLYIDGKAVALYKSYVASTGSNTTSSNPTYDLFPNQYGKTDSNNYATLDKFYGMAFAPAATEGKTFTYYIDDVKATYVSKFDIADSVFGSDSATYTFTDKVSGDVADTSVYTVKDTDGTVVAGAIKSASLSEDKLTLTLTFETDKLVKNQTYTITSREGKITDCFKQEMPKLSYKISSLVELIATGWDNDTKTASFTVATSNSAAPNIVVIAAAYGADNELKAAEKLDDFTGLTNANSLAKTISLSSAKDYTKVYLYIWNSLDEMVPYTGAYLIYPAQ